MEEVIINEEEWRSINGYINYKVSNVGRVFSCLTGRILKPHRTGSNSYGVYLCNDEGRKGFQVHHLVAREFFENNIDEEEWRSINGYINYQVSNIGRVRNSNTGKILRPGISKWKYYSVALTNEAIHKTFDVHRLVAREFLETPLDNSCKYDVDHIDNNGLNNKVNNLRWATRHQNTMKKTKTTKNTASTYKGVWKSKATWRANIKHNYKTIHLGGYKTEEEAARAYNTKATELFGEFVQLKIIE